MLSLEETFQEFSLNSD